MRSVFHSQVPPAASQTLWVRRLREGETAKVVCLSQFVTGYRFHWSGRKTIPCEDPTESCSGCSRGWPVKWKAYFHCYHLDARRQEILEIPESTWRKLASLACYDHAMRGAVLTFRRQQHKRGTISVVNDVTYQQLGTLAPAKDILPDLWKFWTGKTVPEEVRMAHKGLVPLSDGFNPD